MAGVETEIHIAGVENSVYVVFCLYQSLNVRMQYLLQTVLLADVIDYAEHFYHVLLLVG